MDPIKTQNVSYWSRNVPGLDGTPETQAQQKTFFDEVDRVRFSNEPYLPDLLKSMVQPGTSLLEIGFGLGTDLRFFARQGMQVWGLDYSPENAGKVQISFNLFQLPGHITSGDAEALPFSANSFDRVHSWGVLHHTPRTDKTLEEVERVLRPDGRFMIMLYHKGYQYYWLLVTYILKFKWLTKSLGQHITDGYDQTPLSKLYSIPELKRMFNKFEDVKIEIVTFGGIQHHPVLKWVWRLFLRFPFLLRRYGSFAVITGRKSSGTTATNEPVWCCAKCGSMLNQTDTELCCANLNCQAHYPRYKGLAPILHPEPEEILRSFKEIKNIGSF